MTGSIFASFVDPVVFTVDEEMSGRYMMSHTELMEILSQYNLGAMLISRDLTILSINIAGDHLLHGNGELAGKQVPESALPLCQENDDPGYVHINFDEYLIRQPSPKTDCLPENTSLVVFRDATNDYFLDMMTSVIQQVKEGIVMCDSESRLNFFNNQAVLLDSIVAENVLGEKVNDVYTMAGEDNCVLPETLRKKRPVLNHRHRYSTRYGKNVDSVANTYPVIKNGRILGAFNIVEDWSTVNDLHKQIIDLQEKLVHYTSSEKSKTKSALSARYTFQDIIYASSSMHTVLSQCKQVAKTDSSVMIYGETGTGKELFAQSIHNASRRSDGPFLAINCAALPENLLESLLFGSVKGAYTGAENRPGFFEQANHGTLLLDEINSMNISLQAKLLRVLQDGMIRRIGGSSEIKVDVRVLSCINIAPHQAIMENKLRQDLFYRLGVININIPPLRERKEDIALLSNHFIMEGNTKLCKCIKGIDPVTLEIFSTYSWPGNVRELQHAVEHAMIMIPDDQCLITPEYIPQNLLAEDDVSSFAAVSAEPAPSASLHNKLKDIEKTTLRNILRENGGNISKSAQALKMSRQNLQYRIKRYKIDIEEFRRR